ncbi:MAG: glycerol-3-phosphate acyltransferase [Dehalococcoidales bacterium]|nr:glycerol-3-phosphate acyltransferase [Dehalococcoidales bacterium]
MPQALLCVLLFFGAYLFGSIPLAYLIAKWARGIDLRKVGSGNVGMTNVMSSVSIWWGIPVLVFDLGKGLLAVYAARYFGLPFYMQAIVGIAAIIGHNWPVFLKFNAGRGVLTTVGVAFAIEPYMTLILTFLSFIGIPFRQLPLTALISIFLVSLTTVLSNLPGLSVLFINDFGDQRIILALILFIIFLITPVRRMTVPISELGKKISRSEVMLNRFLFDRDIRSRKEWISRNTTK